MLEERINRAVSALREVEITVPPFEEVLAARRRRHVGLAVASLALVIGVGATTFALTRHPRGTAISTGPSKVSSAEIPWVDRPAPPPHVPPQATTTVPLANARPCQARDVSVATNGGNGATGHTILYVEFVNTSATTCLLSGYPTVIATAPGRPPVTAAHGGFFPDNGVTANMAPGGTTTLGVMTERDCAARYATPNTFPELIYDRLSIRLPGGNKTLAVRLDVECGLSVTRFSVPVQSPPTPPDPMENLRATLDLPQSVRRGRTLRYVVTLANPTDHDVALDPCPGYLESSGDIPVKATFALNCDTVHAIPAHGSVRYAMELHMPATAAPESEHQVYWSIIGTIGVRASGDVAIVG